MARFTRIADLQRRQTDRFRKVGVKLMTVHKELVKGGLQDAATLTSGRVTSRQLAAMGHPFGRSGGTGGGRNLAGKKWTGTGRKGQVSRKGVISSLPINRQTGRLRKSVFLRGPKGARQSYDLGFSAPYASFVLNPDGTRRMIARGYFPAIKDRHAARKMAAIIVVRDYQRKA